MADAGTNAAGTLIADQPRRALICSCDDTMPLDSQAVGRGCQDIEISTAGQLCGTEIDRFRAAVGEHGTLMVGCTRQTKLFSRIADDLGKADVRYFNIRETAGWSVDAPEAGPKMAALLAMASEAEPAVSFITLASQGVVLIYGRDERAIEAAELLKQHLDVTVLITPPAAVIPPRVEDVPVTKGRIRSAKGCLGGFEVTIDDFAQALPSSRSALAFGPASDGVSSRCDIVLDLAGAPALFPAADLRDGYVRADPGDPAAVLRAVIKARDLVGTFEKPAYINFKDDLCAHSRSKIVGCRRCLDLCPTGAIAPAGDHVAIDPKICAGCGQCAAACPTGAASYALPPSDVLMRKLRALLLAYRRAGGQQSILLLHDDDHGAPLIEALARFGDGLPANVLPLGVNEVTQVGLETIAAAFAYGAATLRFLLRGKPRHDLSGLSSTIALAGSILTGLGFAPGVIETIETDDPDLLGAKLREIAAPLPTQRPASFLPVGGKREVMRLALSELQQAAPTPVDVIALPQGAPFGAVVVDPQSCTLCLACVSACPTGALRDNPEQPMLRFAEDACVQCGLCKATCPERAITLQPRLNFGAATAPAHTLHQEEPFNCIRCGKAFGVKSSIERVTAKLAGKHWMYREADRRLDALKMCADCRAITAAEAEFASVHSQPRPRIRTTDDYMRERET